MRRTEDPHRPRSEDRSTKECSVTGLDRQSAQNSSSRLDRLLNFQAFATKLRLLTLTFVIGTAGFAARAQQTVFNVPSADVLDKGKTYYEWDATLGDNAPSLAFTPRSVYGLGHGIESGINVSSFNTPNPGTVAVVSATKWEFFESKPLGLAFFAGDHIFLPIDRRNYAVGNSAYIAAAKTFARTRISGGIYDFSAHVIDRANRAGIQASIEQFHQPAPHPGHRLVQRQQQHGIRHLGPRVQDLHLHALHRVRDGQPRFAQRQSQSPARPRLEPGVSPLATLNANNAVAGPSWPLGGRNRMRSNDKVVAHWRIALPERERWRDVAS